MATRRKKPAGSTKKKQKRFNFQLGFTGLAGVTVVSFCLFLWMFLLGLWAGQTILLPPVNDGSLSLSQNKQYSEKISAVNKNDLPLIRPEGRKKVISR